MAWRRRRRFGKPVARQRTGWDPCIHIDSGVNVAAAQPSASLGIFDPVIIHGGLVNKRTKVRRVIYKGGVNCLAINTGYERNVYALAAVLMVVEEDETDTDIWVSAGGSLLSDNRILWTDVQVGQLVEQANTLSFQSVQPPLMRIDCDWKGQVWLEAGEVIVMKVQFATSVSTILTSAGVTGMGRTLFDIP